MSVPVTSTRQMRLEPVRPTPMRSIRLASGESAIARASASTNGTRIGASIHAAPAVNSPAIHRRMVVCASRVSSTPFSSAGLVTEWFDILLLLARVLIQLEIASQIISNRRAASDE